jgi:hypothetical protein
MSRGKQESENGPATSAPEPLGKAERGTAIAVGTMAGGAGGYAVFASSNQAGTAILLILSAIFLLIGIQGTSLIRFSTGTSTVELERRRRVEQALEKASREPDLERAEGIVEGIAIANPTFPSLPEAQARLYKRKLQLAIEQMGYYTLDASLDYLFDLIVRSDRDKTVAVEIKYARPGHDIHIFKPDMEYAGKSSFPVIFVANNLYATSARRFELDEGEDRVKLVTWRDERDNDYLRGALSDLLGSPPSNSIIDDNRT